MQEEIPLEENEELKEPVAAKDSKKQPKKTGTEPRAPRSRSVAPRKTKAITKK
jgi:hypothetical protein